MVAKRRNRNTSRERAAPATVPAPRAGSPEPTAGLSATRIEIAHLCLLLGALALAYLLPFELFVLSYAILGPAHYLTEISWLHDKAYFLPHRAIALALALIALGAMFMASPFWLGLLVSFCFVACAILATKPTAVRAFAGIALAIGVFAVLSRLDTPFAIVWALMPTLIHVSVFTLIFMTVGALKARSVAQFALVVAYLGGIAAILVLPPSQGTVIPALAKVGRDYFGDVAPALGTVFGIPHLTLDARITGLLSFVYTYHYLNWFIKADVIRWASVPRPRLIAIAVLSASATALYFYNYVYGFMVLLLLSLIHVLLEFPLNSISVRQLGAMVGGGLTRTSKMTAGG